MTIKIHTFHSKSIPVIINIDDWPYDLNKLNFPFRVTSKDSPSNYNNLIPDCLTIQLSNHSNISIKMYCHRNRNILSIYDKDVLIALLNIYLNQKRSIHPSYLGRDTKSLPLGYLTTSPIKLTTIANELGYNLPVNQYILSNIYTSLQNLRLTSYEINNSHGFSILEDLSISHTDNTIVARLSTTTYNILLTKQLPSSPPIKHIYINDYLGRHIYCYLRAKTDINDLYLFHLNELFKLFPDFTINTEIPYGCIRKYDPSIYIKALYSIQESGLAKFTMLPNYNIEFVLSK